MREDRSTNTEHDAARYEALRGMADDPNDRPTLSEAEAEGDRWSPPWPPWPRDGEAYVLMTYRADDGTDEEEVIWNSRPGETPDVITLRSGKSATRHHSLTGDVYSPDHRPRPGERIFIDLTMERARYFGCENAERMWDDSQLGPQARERFGTVESMADILTAEYLHPGAHDLIELT